MQHRESLFPVAGSAALKPQAEIRHARIIAFPKQTSFAAPRQPRHVATALRRFANASVRSIHLIAWITNQGIWFRWLIYFAAIFGILIFGVYGPGYDASQFIYFQF